MCRRLAGNTLPGSALRGFTPASLPGLVLWLRADLGVTYVQGPVVATGTTPPAVTMTGTPASTTNTIVLTCTGAGTNTTATFSWTLNGIAQTPFTAAATVVLTGTGITATFPVGAYTNTPSADTYTSVVTVSAWADQSGNGRNVVQATPAAQAALTAVDTNFGSKPTLLFAGAQYMLSSTTISLAQPFTLILVGLSTSGSFQIPFTVYGPLVELGVTSNSFVYVSAGTGVQPTTSLFGSAAILAGTVSGGSGSAYVNSSATALLTGSCGSNAPSGATVSIGANTAGGGGLTGNIAEALIYGSALTTAQLSSLFAYFGAKYAKAWS